MNGAKTQQRTAIESVDALTPRERDVLAALARGYTLEEAARTLGMSPNTAHSHTKHIYQKLGISSRSEAARAAVRLALVEP